MIKARRTLASSLVVLLLMGALPAAHVSAQPLPPGINQAVSFFQLIGSLNRRNRVYSEARRTQADVDQYYENLRERLAENLMEGELITAPSQRPGRSYIRMAAALEEERRAATAQIEAEKNDARRNFNRQVSRNLFDLLVASPGGQNVVDDVKRTVEELRDATLLVQAAVDGASLETALQQLASRVTSNLELSGLVRELGGRLAQEIDGLIGGIIKKLEAANSGVSGGLDEALAEISRLEGRLDEIAGERDRVPVSIAGDGSRLSDVRLVREADAALNVVIDAIVRSGILGIRLGMGDRDVSSMRDRIRESLLNTRRADLSHATTLAQNVRCENVTQEVYNQVAAGLGQAPEVPREGSVVRYLVCYENRTGDAVLAALIGPAKADSADESDSDDDQQEPEVTEGDGDHFAPLEFEIEVLPEDDTSSEQDFGSFFQIWMDAEAEGNMPRFAVPRLQGGVLDVSIDFVTMTMSGSFELGYERLYADDEESLCPGSPQAFYGTASGAFSELPIIPAPTSTEPPSDWGLPAEDWFPRREGGWYTGGVFPLELVMSGIISNSCVELDGEIVYDEFPFDETATVQAWVDSSIDIFRNQGADRVTRSEVSLAVTAVEVEDANPRWRYSLWWRDELDRPIPDPLDG